MKASDILRSYQTAAKCVKAPSAWLRLLMVAVHGQQGCPLAHLCKGRKALIMMRTAKAWQTQGLVTLGRQQWTDGRSRFRHWITITPTGLRALGLES